MPDVIAKVLILERVDHGRVEIFRRARRMGSRIVEELAQKACEGRKILGRDRAGLEHQQAAIVQKIAQRRTERVVERLSVESKSRNDGAEHRLQLAEAHASGHGG